ncbi:hypothetical protein ADIARSV_0096 [Arcticibacter svalbardensis MN12-7]|uniref:PRC-barrel domain-containing protein n=1 Tax=Arcticibacter svalbardensis MN12-7 TaxID=1150600 RepID=R9GYG6_9SPHI|nr:hypothetical protein [Arcticibacter svalbardensis]EOR96673.1 hypothetical protein ADIARSV_0096 [Arcticibacter svalbardensis MN12-7]
METWQVVGIVVDTHNWFGGKKVNIPIVHIRKIEWSDSLVFLDINKADIDQSQLFEEDSYRHLPMLK